MIIQKGPVEPIASALQLRERVTFLKSDAATEQLGSMAAEQISALEPLAAALEAWEERELAYRDRIITPDVQTWN